MSLQSNGEETCSIYWIYAHIRLKGKKMKFEFLVTQFGSRENIGYQVFPSDMSEKAVTIGRLPFWSRGCGHHLKKKQTERN